MSAAADLLKGFERWQVRNLKVCFYSVTEDERFVVEKQGARGWAMSPCSGHGFKFGALMGLELARTIAKVATPRRMRAGPPVWSAMGRPDKMHVNQGEKPT